MGGVGAQLPRYWYWSPFSYLQLCINLPSAGRVPTQQIKNPTDSAAVNLSFAQFFSFLDLKLSRNVDNVFSTWKWSQDNFDFVVQRFFFRINYCISIFFFFVIGHYKTMNPLALLVIEIICLLTYNLWSQKRFGVCSPVWKSASKVLKIY